MAELADAPDLGSGVLDVQVRLLLPAPESTLYSPFCYFVSKSERSMKNTYKKLIEKGIDLSPLGLEMRGEKVRYFCTPKYADIIGYEGVDGVHCCFIRGFKDAVFTVSPMNEPGKHVAKAAECFEDFLSLLLRCRHLAAIEQVNMFTKDEFQEFVSSSEVTEEMQKAFDDLKNFGVKPMENPYDYLKAMRDGFDGSKIKYEDEYYDWVPEEPKMPKWKVTFEGDFTSHRRKARRGREIPVNLDFEWDGKEGVIPAVYFFGKGVVIDCCIAVKREETDNFAQKAEAFEETGRAEELEGENPLDIDIAPTFLIDGKEIKEYRGCGTVFCHLNDEGINDGKYVAEHYGLDMEKDWVINRFAFHVKIKKDENHHIELGLSQRPRAVKGLRFKGQKGDKVEFISPVTGIKHTLTVTDIETEKLPDWTFNEPNMEFPLNYAVISYTVEPPIPDGELMISDNSGGDRPIVKVQDPISPEASCCVGIIGGADGPTAIYLGQSTVHSACSSLYFEEPLSIMWKMKFYKKDSEDIVLNIL